ncbi:MAG TPA: hypothetical protein VF977_15515 [Candidatus Binatia bacterium]
MVYAAFGRVNLRAAGADLTSALRLPRLQRAHSLIVWTAAFFLLWQLTKNPPWLLFAWLLHILGDIPTHVMSYFPTPFLWPFPTPFVEGIPWSTPWFMAASYGTMFMVYGGLFP